jgi:superfamily I DNA/RNA helicase
MNTEWWVDLTQLDPDQESIIALPLDQDSLVLGPPGSGKTNLLLLRANYVSQAGSPNILVVTFGRALREFIVRGSGQYQFDAERIKTSTGCFYDLLKQYGHTRPPDNLPFDRVRLELIERVRALRATLDNPPFDAVFLDEAQDFLPEELDIFCSLGTRVFAVADHKQKVYSGELGLAVLEERCEKRVLTHHYRNGHKICRLADALGSGMPAYEPMLPTSHYNERRNPSSLVSGLLTFDQQVAKIAENLNIQTKAYPNELFGVLCPRRVDVDIMYDALCGADVEAPLQKQVYDEGFDSLGEGTQVCVTTIHGCKGLEFRAVHGAMLESLRKFPLQRNLIYTLATRAKTSLSLYGNPLPAFVQSALLAVEPLPELPPLTRAFGGRAK